MKLVLSRCNNGRRKLLNCSTDKKHITKEKIPGRVKKNK